MVGKFVFGMLTGGALVAGGFVIGAAVFPPQPSIPANDLAAPVAAEAPAPEPVAEAAVVNDSAAQAEPTAPQAPAPAATDAAPQPEAAPAAPEVVDPPAVASPTQDGLAEVAPSVVAEVAGPDVPPAPLVLPQLDTDTVLAALDDAATPPLEPEEEVVQAQAMAPAEAPPAEPIVVADPAPEPAPEASAPEVAPEIAPEIAQAAPAPEGTPELPAALPAELPPEPGPEAPVADAMPEQSPDDSATARLPGTAASQMPGNRPASLPGTETPPQGEPLPEVDSAGVSPATGADDTAEGVITGRLPRIGDTPEAPAATDEAPAPDTRPIAQFAASFENPDGKPTLAIVLIDDGTADLDRAGLAALPFPVSFALDPLDPATPERAALYRAAGKEVVMLAIGIADGAQASDVEVSFQTMAQGLPEAVAVMDLPQPVFQNMRPLASIVVPVIGAQGRGLLTWDQGLNAADQVARREAIAAAVIFRDLASAGEDSIAIRRVLDRAVFKAGQDGSVALAGTASPATVAALLEWTVEGRAVTVALAPLTAVMTVQ